MKLRLLVVCLAFALMDLTAFAQDNPSTVNASTASTTGVGSTDVGLYVNPIGIGISNSKADTGVFAFLGDGTTQRTFYGADIGGYVNFFHAQKYDAGIDLRDIIVTGNGARLNSFLVGGRIAAKPLSGGAAKLAETAGLAAETGDSDPLGSSGAVGSGGCDAAASS